MLDAEDEGNEDENEDESFDYVALQQ